MRDYDANPIVVYTAYTCEEYKDFQVMHFRKHKRQLIAILVVFFLFVTMLCVWPSAYSPGPLFTLIAIIYMVFLFRRILVLNGNYPITTFYEQHRNAYRGGALMTFMNDHYTSVSEDGAYKVVKDSPYDDVTKIVEMHGTYYLYNTPSRAEIIKPDGIVDNSATPEELGCFLLKKFNDMPYTRMR